MKKEVFCKNKNFVIAYPKSFYMEKFHGMSFLFEHADIFIFLALGFFIIGVVSITTSLHSINENLKKIAKNLEK